MDNFGGHHKGVISIHFRVFSQCQGTKWEYFLVLLKFKIFLGGA